MKFLKLITALLLVLGILVVGRYLQEKYLQKNNNVSLKDSLSLVQKDIFYTAREIDNRLGKVLGETDTRQGISGYVRQELPDEVKERIQKSQVVKEIQEEVANIVNDTTKNIQNLPKNEVDKLKKDISSEICKQVLEEDKENK